MTVITPTTTTYNTTSSIPNSSRCLALPDGTVPSGFSSPSDTARSLTSIHRSKNSPTVRSYGCFPYQTVKMGGSSSGGGGGGLTSVAASKRKPEPYHHRKHKCNLWRQTRCKQEIQGTMAAHILYSINLGAERLEGAVTYFHIVWPSTLDHIHNGRKLDSLRYSTTAIALGAGMAYHA
jgi:hypothetical protein